MWINVSRQQGNRRSFQMPITRNSTIPPPGPPSRSGVLTFSQSSITAAANSPATARSATAYSCISPGFLGYNTATIDPSITAYSNITEMCRPATADMQARSIGGRLGVTGEQCNETNKPAKSSGHEELPVAPPSRFKRFTSFLKGSKKEKTKTGESKKNEKEKGNRQLVNEEATKPRPTAPQLPEEIDDNYGSSSIGARNAWGPLDMQSNERASSRFKNGPENQHGPVRKSFRLSGNITNISAEKNVLPLWLEETSGARHTGSTGHAFKNTRNEMAVCDTSFESRWESLNCSNKKQLPVVTVRPPGWEDVDKCGRKKRNKPVKRNQSFRPSFVINEMPKNSDELTTTNNPQTSTPRIISTDTPHAMKVVSLNNTKQDIFTMPELSANIDSILNNSLMQDKEQFSMSNLAPHSASNSPNRSPSQSSTYAITDRHLWASSDSFICEDFSFCKSSKPKALQDEKISRSPPRSFSQVLLNPQEINEQELTSHDDLYEDLDFQVDRQSSFDQRCTEAEGKGNISTHIVNANENAFDLETQYNLDSENIAEGVSYFLKQTPLRLSGNAIKVRDNSLPDNWIRFDYGSFDNVAGYSSRLNHDIADNRDFASDDVDFVHQTNFETDSRNPSESMSSPTSPILPRNLSGSTLNLVEPRLQQTSPERYAGQLVRSYSIRGRRASKRVTRNVSHKIKSAEYGKLTEPVAPMYSKAAMTMASGPGLFEQNTLPIDEKLDEGEDVPTQEQKKEKKTESPPVITDKSNTSEANSTLSPGLPIRAGSLRVPRLPAIFLRRSLSLNAPKVNRGDVPFQRLPERRGSFRRAISGIGALARNFRKRPEERTPIDGQSSINTEKASGSSALPRLHRSGSTGSSFRQIPKAPRLPRRTISHKQSSSKSEPN